MNKLATRTRRPSASLVISIIALIISLTGTGFAAGVLPARSVGTKQLKNRAVTAPKLAANSVNSVRVANGSLLAVDFKAGQLPAGAKGDTGAAGATGAAGTARAYAHVAGGATPALITARTKNFTAVTSPAAGYYCLTPAAGISPASHPLVASVDWTGTLGPEGNASAMWRSEALGCTAGDYGVYTERFSVLLSTESAPAADIGFVVIVP